MRTCPCICAVTGHAGICQVTPEPGLRLPIYGRSGRSAEFAVCRPCYEARVREARLAAATR